MLSDVFELVASKYDTFHSFKWFVTAHTQGQVFWIYSVKVEVEGNMLGSESKYNALFFSF